MAIDDPMFEQFPGHNALISEWFEAKGWPVSTRYFDFDRGIFAWRHEADNTERTIRITQSTLEDYPADKILALFEAARVGDAIAAHPSKYVVLRRQANGAIGFDILDKPPM